MLAEVLTDEETDPDGLVRLRLVAALCEGLRWTGPSTRDDLAKHVRLCTQAEPMRRRILTVLVAVVAAGLDPGASAQEPTTVRVSVTSEGDQVARSSYEPAISADGQVVAFTSRSSRLVPGDTNRAEDVFVHDPSTGEATRVSVRSNGSEGNGISWGGAVSANGRYVAFHSDASNLVPRDRNGEADVFVHDRGTGETVRVSVRSNGAEGNAGSWGPAISADGHLVAFASNATNLAAGDTNRASDVFVHNLRRGRTTLVSTRSSGVQGNAGSYEPAIAASGMAVSFTSVATNLVPHDTNGAEDVFVHDRKTGRTARVSVRSSGAQAAGCSELEPWFCSRESALSGDGRFVVFSSEASNLVRHDTNGVQDVFMHDRRTDRTIRIDLARDGSEVRQGAYGADISDDGRFMMYVSFAGRLVERDTNHATDIFLYDRVTGTTSRASLTWAGRQANDGSGAAAISGDGTYVAFVSAATNLVTEDDTNHDVDVFRRGPIV